MINHKGQITAVKITSGNIADSSVLDEIARRLTGKLYADKGYINREMFTKLWQRGLHLITGIRRNMRNHLMLLGEVMRALEHFYRTPEGEVPHPVMAASSRRPSAESIATRVAQVGLEQAVSTIAERATQIAAATLL